MVRPRLAYEVTFAWPDTGKHVKEVLTSEPLVVEQSHRRHVVVLRSPRDPGSHVVLQADERGQAVQSHAAVTVVPDVESGGEQF